MRPPPPRFSEESRVVDRVGGILRVMIKMLGDALWNASRRRTWHVLENFRASRWFFKVPLRFFRHLLEPVRHPPKFFPILFDSPRLLNARSSNQDRWTLYMDILFPALCEMEAFGPRNRNSNHSFRNVLDIKERKRRSGVENVNESVRVTAPLLVFMLTKEIIPWLHFSPGVSLIPPFNSIPGGHFRMKRITSTHLKQTNTLTNKPMRFKRQ